MEILHYEIKIMPIQKIRENYYYTAFILKPENYEISTLLHPPSAKPRTVVSSTLTKIVRGKGPFDDANIRGLLLDSKSMTYERPTKGTPAIHPNPIDNIESECP